MENENQSKNKAVYFILVAAILVLLDQATKIMVKGFTLFGIEHKGMFLGESISVIGDFLTITFVENPGMAFGIEFGAGKILLSIFSLIASIGIIWLLFKLEEHPTVVRIGVMLILAGAFGNFVDRMFYGVFYSEAPLFYGHVVDFIRVDIPDIDIGPLYYTHWPVFNFADAYVTVGVIILLIFHKQLPEFSSLMKKEENTAIEENEEKTHL